MSGASHKSNPSDKRANPGLQHCPHCGEPLSPWQQVLLAVDRALVCKKCWYRIILAGPGDSDSGEPKPLPEE